MASVPFTMAETGVIHNPAGEPADCGTETARSRTPFLVPEGRNVYLLGQFPDHELIGELVTSSPATSRAASPSAAPEPTPPAPEGRVSVVR